MFNAIGYVNTSWKKKFKSELIPASFFQRTEKNNHSIVVEEPKKVENQSIKKEDNSAENTNSEDLSTQKVVLSKETNEHQISALSLKSIKKKRELEASINPVQINQEDLPKDNFTFDELKNHWDYCSNQYYQTGRMLMSSTMNMANLTLNDTVLKVEFPNEGSKLSFEENLYDLVSYIHKKLNNYHLKVEVIVNEKSEIKKAYTINDKLDYLKEINPALNTLIKTFDLEIKP